MQRFIIERYLIRETLQNFLAVISILLLIYISNRFVRYLAEAAAGELDSGVILELLVLKLTTNSIVLLPLSLFIGVLLAMGRFYRDSEIIAMQAGGVGVQRLLRGIGALSVVFALLIGFMSNYVAPMAAASAAEVTLQARNDSEVTGLRPGQFKDFGKGDQIIYLQDATADRSVLHNVFVQVRRPDGLDIVFAESASVIAHKSTGDRFMVLGNGYRYEGQPGTADFVVHQFESHGVRIRKQTAKAGIADDEQLSLSALWQGGTHQHAAELQWRISLSLSAILLSLLAVPLARTSSRSGKYGKLFTAVLIYFVYINLMTVARKAVERGELSSYIGIWPVHLGMAAIVLVMLFSMSGGLARMDLWRRFGRSS
ncbi:MAG: LPS export ABC transporter permease LptF [Chromatiales bacterium]|nr:LPS export ABC transporter permease LptF [Chromatiales bacterium]